MSACGNSYSGFEKAAHKLDRVAIADKAKYRADEPAASLDSVLAHSIYSTWKKISKLGW